MSCGAARFCSVEIISIPMCDQSTACNPHWHIRHRYITARGITVNLLSQRATHRSVAPVIGTRSVTNYSGSRQL